MYVFVFCMYFMVSQLQDQRIKSSLEQKLVLSYPPVHTSPGLPSVLQTEEIYMPQKLVVLSPCPHLTWVTECTSDGGHMHATGGILFPELRSCVKVEVAIPNSHYFLLVNIVSEEVKQH